MPTALLGAGDAAARLAPILAMALTRDREREKLLRLETLLISAVNSKQ